MGGASDCMQDWDQTLPGRADAGDPPKTLVLVARPSLTANDCMTPPITLVTDEGSKIHIDAVSTTTVQTLSGHEPDNGQVLTVTPLLDDTGVEISALLLTNNGFEEPGIPGVRLATVSGLTVETDAYGRYHIAAVDVPRWDRGGNFILKLDHRTLPNGSKIISENPRVIRLTEALMTRINFSVDLPNIVTHRVTDQIAPVRFRSGSWGISTEYADALRNMLARYARH